MKARVPLPKAAKAEIMKEVKRMNAQYELDMDALALWTLHQYCGFGQKRLLEFYRHMLDGWKELHEFYEGGGTEYYAARAALKRIGVDVEEEFLKFSQKNA